MGLGTLGPLFSFGTERRLVDEDDAWLAWLVDPDPWETELDDVDTEGNELGGLNPGAYAPTGLFWIAPVPLVERSALLETDGLTLFSEAEGTGAEVPFCVGGTRRLPLDRVFPAGPVPVSFLLRLEGTFSLILHCVGKITNLNYELLAKGLFRNPSQCRLS